MLNLLKKKCSIGIAEKSRKKYDALVPAKRIRAQADGDVMMDT